MDQKEHKNKKAKREKREEIQKGRQTDRKRLKDR